MLRAKKNEKKIVVMEMAAILYFMWRFIFLILSLVFKLQSCCFSHPNQNALLQTADNLKFW